MTKVMSSSGYTLSGKKYIFMVAFCADKKATFLYRQKATDKKATSSLSVSCLSANVLSSQAGQNFYFTKAFKILSYLHLPQSFEMNSNSQYCEFCFRIALSSHSVVRHNCDMSIYANIYRF